MFKEWFQPAKKEIETTALALMTAISAGCTNPPIAPSPHPEKTPTATPNPYQENINNAVKEAEQKKAPWISKNGVTYRVRSATADVSPTGIDAVAIIERSDAVDSPIFSDASTGSMGFLLYNKDTKSIAALSKIVSKPEGSSVEWNMSYRTAVASGSEEFHPEVLFIGDPAIYAKLLQLEASGSVQKIDSRVLGREGGVGTIYRWVGKINNQDAVGALVDELDSQDGTKHLTWQSGEFSAHPPVELQDPELAP